MTESVNGLIFNTLITERAIHLPGVGSLHIERKSATCEGNNIVAPRYDVAFSTHLTARSIVDVISSTASVSIHEAEEIYSRWLDKVRNNNEVVISGVGTLIDKSFITDDELAKCLNAHLTPKMQISNRKGSSLRWAIRIIIAIVAICLSLYLIINKPTFITNEDNQTNYTENQIIESTIVAEEIVETDTIEQEIVAKEIAQPETNVIEDWTLSTDIRHRVVVGSYSTSDNAHRAADEICSRLPEVKCSVFQLGSMYAVAVFGSTERTDCEKFTHDYRNQFPQMWIHTPKRYR